MSFEFAQRKPHLTHDDDSTDLTDPSGTMGCSRRASNRRGVIGDFGTPPDAPGERYPALGVVRDFAREPPLSGDAAAE